MEKEEKMTWEEIGRALYEEWASRPAFSFVPTQDPVYTATRDSLMREASRSAADAEARATARTGGYGNSYAASVGARAIEDATDSLTDLIPKLYDLAYGRYVDEGEELQDRLRRVNELAERDAAAAKEEAKAAEKEAEEQAAADKAAASEAQKREKEKKALLASSLWPTGYDPDDVTVPTGDWYGVNEQEAVAVMLKAGAENRVVKALVSRAEWTRHKRFNDPDGTKNPSTYGYKNYEEYLCAYVNMALDMVR